MAKESADKKLLKLIESTQAKESETSPSLSQPVSKEAQQVLQSVKGLGMDSIKWLPFLFKFVPNLHAFVKIFKSPTSLGLKEINQMILVGIALVVFTLISDFLNGTKIVERGFSFSWEEQSPASMEIVLPALKDLSEYLQIINRRNIFQPYEPKVVEKVEVQNLGKERVSEKTQNFKLVGISWLDTPDSASAMIENTQSGVTYFLKSGESVNNVTVKRIFADSIILDFQGEELEMKL